MDQLDKYKITVDKFYIVYQKAKIDYSDSKISINELKRAEGDYLRSVQLMSNLSEASKALTVTGNNGGMTDLSALTGVRAICADSKVDRKVKNCTGGAVDKADDNLVMIYDPSLGEFVIRNKDNSRKLKEIKDKKEKGEGGGVNGKKKKGMGIDDDDDDEYPPDYQYPYGNFIDYGPFRISLDYWTTDDEDYEGRYIKVSNYKYEIEDTRTGEIIYTNDYNFRSSDEAETDAIDWIEEKYPNEAETYNRSFGNDKKKGDDEKNRKNDEKKANKGKKAKSLKNKRKSFELKINL